MIRYEILLPLFYNDGHPIEADKFLATDDELVVAFGSKYQSTVYSDQLIRIRVDVDERMPTVKRCEL
jgi:hypothetical protein